MIKFKVYSPQVFHVYPAGSSINSAICIQLGKFRFNAFQWADMFAASFLVNIYRFLHHNNNNNNNNLFSLSCTYILVGFIATCKLQFTSTKAGRAAGYITHPPW